MSSHPPGRDALKQAALRYLERFSATEAGLVRVLDRKIYRWQQRAVHEGVDLSAYASDIDAARREAREIAAKMVELGVVNDRLYAESQVRRMVRAGRSRRKIDATLMTKGVGGAERENALPDDDDELHAAIRYTRKRRLGPFRRDVPEDDAPLLREQQAMARAGFARSVAEQALAMEPEQALSLIEKKR